ncbi:MAG: TonB-dependent receptor [Saprospiraceae bacterium]|nr:TonB-dependent receptor [Saprospiraceae bacterium]
MKKTFLLFSTFLLVNGAMMAQNLPTDTTLKVVQIRETVVSATRSKQARSAVAQQVLLVRKPEIEQMNAQTTADLIQQSGAAFVQRSQQGGGSPVLRGFEASRVLLVVDGIRMNNAIYRAGHLQNILTIDNAMLDRAEVLYGPSTTVYGTDALGGALCFFTKNPVFSQSRKLKTVGSAFVRYGTVNEEKTAHADVSLGGKKIAGILSMTYSDFGDLRMGKNPGSEGRFGERPTYVARINGRDSIIANSDPYVQKFSAYQQMDMMGKVVFRPNAHAMHTLNVQLSTSSDIPRYDRLTDKGAGGNGFASAEWYYGPQDRRMVAYKLEKQQVGWFDEFQTTVNWQGIEESRHNRNFGATRRTDRVEALNVFGIVSELGKTWGNQALRLGLDAQYNDVKSTARRVDVNTGAESAQSTRYPDGGSQTLHIAAFATHQWQRKNWSFSEGLRAGFAALDARFDNKDFYPFPFDKAQQRTPVVSGHAGAVWNGPGKWRFAVNASTGFRVPNVDDLAKVFDSAVGNVVVPNPDLKPEKTFNLDVNLSRNITNRLRWENVLWGTLLQDAIITDVYTFNGQDSILYDGMNSRVLANQNARKARLFGFSSGLDADLSAQWAVYASVSYTKGEIIESENNKPLDHIPPLYGRAGLRWHTPKAVVETWTLFNTKKTIDQYNNEGEDNAQYAPPGGMPGWFTLNLRATYRFSQVFALQTGLENILDRQYRNFASGINAPGRNVWVTLRVNW